VEDSGGFDLEPDVTCLVWKNEFRKTADRQALYRFNPVEESAVFNEVIARGSAGEGDDGLQNAPVVSHFGLAHQLSH
jgi:hypothetical protein